MSGETGTTKIDIVTLTGLTATDGSIIDAGAVIKFETIFPIGIAGFIARIKVYRNREIFEAGYDGISLYKIEDEITQILGAEFFDLTPTVLNQRVAEHINAQYSDPDGDFNFNGDVCEVQITE